MVHNLHRVVAVELGVFVAVALRHVFGSYGVNPIDICFARVGRYSVFCEFQVHQSPYFPLAHGRCFYVRGQYGCGIVELHVESIVIGIGFQCNNGVGLVF